MADNEFQLKIEGEDVTPYTVDIGDLADVLRALRGIVTAISRDIENEPDDILSLVAIGDGSDKLVLCGSPSTLHATRILTKALATNTTHRLPKPCHAHLRNLWKSTFDNGWDACRFVGNISTIGQGAILRSVELFPDALQYRGSTIVYGDCVRVGGEGRKTAQLKLLDGTTLYIKLKTKQLAQEIGKRLYQTVGLSGEAFWAVETNALLEFRADFLTEYSDRNVDGTQRSIVQSLESLAKAAGNRWTDIDPDEFIEEQRRE